MSDSKKSLKITPKMKKGISACELILGIEFTGKSFEEASKFLETNLPKIQGKDVRDYMEPSEKMLKAISFIQSKTGDVFEGSTMREASEFISANLDKARSIK